MFAGTLLISGRNWLWPGLLLLGAALVAVLWAYRRAPADRWVQAVGLFLKILGLLALFGCLLEPLWSGQRARPGANYLAIVADNSEGLRIKDRGESRSRGDSLRQLLTTDRMPWQGKLEENFQVRRYLFDSRLQFTKDFGDLDFNGRSSAIGGALRALADRYRGQPLAGVLLLTDGNATDLAQGVSELPGLPPIYPVVIGSDAPIKDIAIQKVTVAQTAFEDAPVSIQADVTSIGFVGAEVVGQLAELLENPSNPSAFQEKNVAEQTQKAVRDAEVMAFRFQVRPEKSGIRFYRLRVGAKNELAEFTKPEVSSEATLANNTRILAVDRGKGPYRVLYVAGRPNWEYKFFHRAIEEDDQVQLSALIRIAKREPKLEFRGRAGESSNPLFRGFGNQSKDETEQYDQPVLRPIGADEDEFTRLQAGFPKTPEELYRYEAIILDDLEAGFFTHEQMSLLQKFVSERGGGFLMLGGQESFEEGKFERTPIGEMLPIYLNNGAEQSSPGGYRLDLTREGWLQPWARLRNNEADEKKRLEDVPPFYVLNQVREFKPGASVIAKVTDQSGKSHDALVVQRFGNGRSAALLIGDLWHWGLKDKDTHRDMDKAWRQLVRWLIADVPSRIEARVEPKPSDPDQAVLLQVRVKDEKFQPMENAAVTLRVRPVGAQVDTPPSPAGQTPAPAAQRNPSADVRLTAEPALSEPGLYQATYIPRATGGYFAEAVITNSVGAEVGRAQAGWSSDPAAEEFRSLRPNRALLEDIAKKTGGEVIPIDRLDAFAASLPQRKVPIAESWTLPLWHQPVVFLFALACFVGEWGLRRWKGLA
jgi:uncharacterized membrane protein